MQSCIVEQWIDVAGLKLHYLTAGTGEAVLLLHGWPTSAYLYRHLIAPLARTKRVVALDLPGFGKSDKPLHAAYSFDYHEHVVDAFLEQLGIAQVTLVGHDIGGPIGLVWALRHQAKMQRLVLLNTFVYPNVSWAAILFVLAILVPLVSDWLVNPSGIKTMMRLGVNQKQRLTDAVLREYQAPFHDRAARKVLLKTVRHLSPAGLREIADKLPRLDIPVALIYGEDDRILPDVAETMRRVKRDLPQAQLTALRGCGHFLQEDEPEQLAALLEAFLNA